MGKGLGNGAGQGSVGHEEGSREGSGERTEWSHDGSRRARKGSIGPEKRSRGTMKGDLTTLGVFCRQFDGPGSL